MNRIGIDSSYLNKIAEGKTYDDWYFIEDDVLTEVFYKHIEWLINTPTSFVDAKKKNSRLLDFLIKNKYVYIGLAAEWFLLKNDEIEEQYFKLESNKDFFADIKSILDCKTHADFLNNLKHHSIDDWLKKLNKNYAKQREERDKYWEKFLAQSGDDECVDLSKLEDAILKRLSDGIEIEEINEANIIPETQSKEKFIQCVEKNGFKKDKEDVFTNGDLEVFFKDNKVFVKILTDKDHIQKNYIALYAYTVHQCFLDALRQIKKDIKNDKKSKIFFVKLKDETEGIKTEDIKFEQNTLVDLKIGFIQLPFLDEFRTCDKGQFTMLTMLQKLLPEKFRQCKIMYFKNQNLVSASNKANEKVIQFAEGL